MDIILKQRMVGAIVLISLAVIFIPMLLSGKGDFANSEKSNIPAKPKYEIKAVGKQAAFSDETDSNEAATNKTIEGNIVESDKENGESISTKSHVIVLTDKTTAPEKEVPAAEKPGDNKAQTETATTLEPTTTPVNVPPQKTDSNESKQIKSVSSNKPDEEKKNNVTSKLAMPPVKTPPPSVKSPTSVRAKPKSSVKAGWIVQVGSFEKRNNANQLRDKLRTKGFAAFVEPRKGETPVYRVRVGPEAKRKSAEKLQRSLLNQQKLKGLVLKYP